MRKIEEWSQEFFIHIGDESKVRLVRVQIASKKDRSSLGKMRNKSGQQKLIRTWIERMGIIGIELLSRSKARIHYNG